MRRARGCGGRFLNTKKLESNNSNFTPEKGNTGANKNIGSSNYQYGVSVSMHNGDFFGAPNGAIK